MAYGDVGGPITALAITCKTADTGNVALHRGDAVKLTGPYEISNVFEEGDLIFGEVLMDCSENNTAVPVRVRGVCEFQFSGNTPVLDGVSGVIGTGTGLVLVSDETNAAGLAVKVNEERGTVEVLL